MRMLHPDNVVCVSPTGQCYASPTRSCALYKEKPDLEESPEVIYLPDSPHGGAVVDFGPGRAGELALLRRAMFERPHNFEPGSPKGRSGAAERDRGSRRTPRSQQNRSIQQPPPQSFRRSP